MRVPRTAGICLATTLVISGTIAGSLAWHEGCRLYVVHTGSMAPTLNPGDAVLDRPVQSSVTVGEVITFGVHTGPDSVVTHRVYSVEASGIKTKGDANRTADPWTVQQPDVVGSKLVTLPYAGFLLVYLQHPQGIASVLTTAIALILLWQLFFPAASSGSEPEVPRKSRHKRELVRRERVKTTAVLMVPARRWRDVHSTSQTFLRSSLGPVGRPSDRRGYFD